MLPSFFQRTPGLSAFYNEGIARGYSPYALAGLAGGFMQESGGRTDARQKGGNGMGLAQWDDRRNAMQAYARSLGKDWTDPEAQAKFVFHELDSTEGRAKKALLSAKNPMEAAQAALMYERPAGWRDVNLSAHPTLGWANRLKQAEEAYASMSGSPMSYAMGNQQGPQDQAGNAIQQTFGQPQSQTQQAPEDDGWTRMGNIGNGLMGAGAALMAINNPSGASAIMSGMRQSAKKNRWQHAGSTPDGTGLIQMNPDTGEVRTIPIQGAKPKEDLTTFQKDYKFIQDNPDARKAWETAHGVNPTEPLDNNTKEFWASSVLANPDSLKQVPAKIRPQVMESLTKQAQEAGFTGKDMYQTIVANRGNIADDVRRSQLIGTLDTFKGEFLAGANQVTKYAKELERATGVKTIEGLRQWAEKHAGTPEAAKIVALDTAFEGLGRGYNRALSTASGGNVTGEQRAMQLLNSSMPLDQIEAGLKVMTSDVIRLNEYARFARDNSRAKNAGKPIPHPELEDEEKFLKGFSAVPQSQTVPESPQSSSATPVAPQPSNVISELPKGAQKASDGYYYWQENGKWKRAKPQ